MNRTATPVIIALFLLIATKLSHALVIPMNTGQLEALTIENVNGTFQTISLEQSYTSPVIVCTHELTSTADPAVVTRIDNVSGSSFDLSVQIAYGSLTPVASTVHCLVAEEGVNELADGTDFEARTVLSNGTNRRVNWSILLMENVTAGGTPVVTGSYSNPTVLGQVMSYNDTEFTAFHTNRCSRSIPWTGAGNLCVGKHTGFDSSGGSRADETLGFFVIEGGSGSGNPADLDCIAHEHDLGPDTIIGANFARSYSLSDTYIQGVATQNAMDGVDGSWSVFLGTDPFASDQIDLGDEETDTTNGTANNPRTHTTEQHSYWVFRTVDYGDAPDSYSTTDAAGGAEHLLASEFVTAGAADIFIGSSVDHECDATPDPMAASDTDDGGVVFPPTPFEFSAGDTYSVTVPYTGSAELCGWIDFDYNGQGGDGTFDTDERVCMQTSTCAGGGVSGTCSLVFTAPADFIHNDTSNTYARFRIGPNVTEVQSPTGLARGGEVEDYEITADTLPVTLSSISNEVTANKVKVDWTTSSELFNVGYQLWGLDGHDSKWEKLHAWLVRSGSGNAVEPQSYSRTASIPGSVKDLVAIGISSVDSDGSEHYYGPFELNQSYGDLTQLKPIGWNHIRSEVDASMISKGYVKDRVNGYRRVTAASAADAQTVVDITVDQSGLYRITSSELAAAGMDVSAIKNRQLAIIDHSGAPVVRYVWARGTGLGLNKTLGVSGEVYFYGQSPDEHAGLYSEVSQYRLVVDKTKALIAPLQGKQGISSGFSASYREQVLVEVDAQYTLAAQANDPWVERVMVSYANHTSVASKQLDLPDGIDQSQGVDLLIGVGRGSGLNPIDANGDGIQDPEHIITGAVADESGTAVWQTPVSAVGTGVWQARIPVNTVLGDVDASTPGLQVNVGASFSAGSGYRFSEIQLDTMGLEYARSYTPKADQLHLSFTGPNEGESGYAVQMTDRGYAMVFAYNEAGALVRLVPESQVRQTVNGEKVRLVKFAPLVGAGTQNSDVRYWLSSKPGYLKAGLSVDTLASQASLVAQAQGADFLMIAHPAFMGAELEGYALHKQGQGYRTAIVDYSEIVRVYGGGQAGPEGLTQYIRAVEAAGDLSAVLLIGSSVYDHLDRLGTDSMTFIPGHYGESNYSRFTVSDVPYITGADGTLFASMGRWPVRELSELNTIIAKSINWSNTDHTNAEVLLIAEHTVAGENIDFAGAMESNLSPIVPVSMTTNKVYVDEILDANPGHTLTQALTEAKGQIIDGLNNAPSVVLYNGHGTTSQLSNKGLFKSSDVNSVTASGAEIWLPMSCYVTYYESTHVNTLAHQLMFSGNAVNISGAMLLSNQGSNIAAGKAILDGTVNQGKTLGEAVNEHKAHQDDPKLNINWAVLGDPTQRM